MGNEHLSQYTQYETLTNNAILLTLRSLSEHYTDVSVNSHPIIANDRGIIGNSLITASTCCCQNSSNTSREATSATKLKSNSLPSLTPTF